MITQNEFEECIRQYEATALNRTEPRFQIGNRYNIRERWDRGGWEHRNRPGVYGFYAEHGGLIYVGEAYHLDTRTGSYFRRNPEKVVEAVHLWSEEPIFLQMVAVGEPFERFSLEAFLIEKLQPPENKRRR